MQNTEYWILFQAVFGYGTARTPKALEHFGHPSAIFDKPFAKLAATGFFTKAELSRLAEASVLQAQTVLEKCRKIGCRVLTPDDDEYPDRLRQTYACPSVLYVLGELNGLDEQLAIAVVGTRNNTLYGKRAAEELSQELAGRGVVIVSGLASGIDTISHTAAIKAGGKTIAVLGNGIDTIYPAANKELHRSILEHGGAVITEFPPGCGVLPYHFPIRNRIISGLSQGTLVIEGTRHSGSLITAGHALAQGRDVFAVPGSIYSDASAGANWLISQGAVPVSSWRDIVEEYESFIEFEEMPNLLVTNDQGFDNIETNVYNRQKEDVSPVQQELTGVRKEKDKPDFLTETQQQVLNVLGEEPMTADSIHAKSGLSVSTVLSSLTQMEIFGVIKAYPGRRFGL